MRNTDEIYESKLASQCQGVAKCLTYNDDEHQAAAQGQKEVQRLREALAGLLAIVDDSRGVAGYHLNGAIADWDEFPEVESARAMLAAAPQDEQFCDGHCTWLDHHPDCEIGKAEQPGGDS